MWLIVFRRVETTNQKKPKASGQGFGSSSTSTTEGVFLQQMGHLSWLGGAWIRKETRVMFLLGFYYGVFARSLYLS